MTNEHIPGAPTVETSPAALQTTPAQTAPFCHPEHSEGSPAKDPSVALLPQDDKAAPLHSVTDDDLFNLMSQLEGLLTNGPARAQNTLLRQSETLDALFSTLVARHLKDAVTGHFYGTTKPSDTAAWLGMILQVQKQCSEAIRVASAVNYMDTMASVQLTPSALMARRPLPRVDS